MRKTSNPKTALVISLFLLLLRPAVGTGAVIYVDGDANGANDGSSWGDAYNWLQDALADANSSFDVNEVWLAEGIYRPDRSSAEPNGSGDREATFQLKDDIAIYGGFPSGGGQWEDRDPNAHETVLSGDLIGNDNVVEFSRLLWMYEEPTRSENSYHVLTSMDIGQTTIIDGLTVEGGQSLVGGGMYNSNSSPRIVNCIFRSNLGDSVGGGIYNRDGSNSTVIDCTFIGNSSWSGAGIANIGSSPTLVNCRFSGNSARYGAGVYGGSGTITNCTFIGNGHFGTTDGGAMNIGGSAVLRGCTFHLNAGLEGGAMNISGGSPTLINCTFSSNRSRHLGGGICVNSSSPTLINCTFSGNSVEGSGGGIFSSYSNTVLTNCRFTGNSADKGGGIYVSGSRRPILTNCTFSGNWSPKGNALYRGSYANNYPIYFQLTNCILWDGGNEVFNADGSTIDIIYSDVEGGWEGEGTIDADPCFVEAGYWVDACDVNIVVEPGDPNAIWIEGDYHLLQTSPCIDTGDPNFIPEPNETDVDGNPRVADGDGDGNSVVDMGAYEFTIAEPVEPLEMLAELGELVEELGLSKGIENSLSAKVEAAIGVLEDDNEKNDGAAVNILGAFMNAASAQSGKKIAESQAEVLIAEAAAIIEALEGG